MKLFVMNAGDIRNPNKGMLTPGRDEGVPITIPVSMYLIDHPDGLVLVDTGNAVYHWPEFLWGDHDDDPKENADRRIAELGYDPKKVKYVIMSHMHGDHAGGMELFPDATFIVRREELKTAWWPPCREPGAGFYMYPDYKDTRLFKYTELDDDEDFDVFGDGTVICTDTRGHTRGHQSVVVDLPETGKTVLALDAASLKENLDDRIYPGTGTWDIDMGLRSIDKLRKLRDEGAFIILGHDPEQWKSLKKAPDHYS
ncbi:MAG: N-acyl homoserine lactonase family protein [Oscillospiraceae bacterium]|nr:N-acyl homoserine lactonase family protein [Oscillospiraceae bacterium]